MCIFKRIHNPPYSSDRSFLSVCLGLSSTIVFTSSLQLVVSGVILFLIIKPSL